MILIYRRGEISPRSIDAFHRTRYFIDISQSTRSVLEIQIKLSERRFVIDENLLFLHYSI